MTNYRRLKNGLSAIKLAEPAKPAEQKKQLKHNKNKSKISNNNYQQNRPNNNYHHNRRIQRKSVNRIIGIIL